MARPYRKSLTSLAELVDDPGRIGRWLYRAGPIAQLAFGGIAALGTAAGAFALREPFLAMPLAGEVSIFGSAPMPLRDAALAAQALGLALAQPLGAVAVVELDPNRRVPALAVSLGLGELALVAVALLPSTLAPACLLVNGLALGLVWGQVFSFLEGRRISDALGALAASGYLLGGGVMRALGDFMVTIGVPAWWVPATAGAAAGLPLAVALWMLAQFPPPTRFDEADRLFRAPMTAAMRWHFLRASGLGLALLMATHTILAAYRELRTRVTHDLWGVVSDADGPSVLTAAEVPAAIAALVAIGGLSLVRDHRRALRAIHGLILLGLALIGGSAALFLAGFVGATPWMILVGAGIFLVHVPFTCVLFDRMVAALGMVGTAVFMIFVAGAFGQVGRLMVVVVDLSWGPPIDTLHSFAHVSLAVAALAAGLVIASSIYFRGHRRDPLTVTGGI